MKKLTLILLVLIPLMGFAQSFNTSFVPQSIKVNSMSITSFDPDDPDSQPLLSTLTVNYAGNESPKPRMDIKVRVVWNNIMLAEADFQSRSTVDPDIMYPVVFTSRQLISNEGHPDFAKKPGSADISVDNILDSPTFGDAVLSGYFPDGNLEIRIWVREYANMSWTVPESSTGDARFIIMVRNAGNITLLSPGVAIGQNPPQVSGAPLSFLWNALDTSFNNYELTIREYPQSHNPTINNVESTGTEIYRTAEGQSAMSGFSDYLALSPGKYYAWRVKTKVYTEFNPNLRQKATSPYLSSNWFVFQYTDQNDAASGVSELQAMLNLLNNNDLRNLLNTGYNTVGTVLYEGRTYSGQDAVDLVESLLGKDIQVRLQD